MMAWSKCQVLKYTVKLYYIDNIKKKKKNNHSVIVP